MGCDDSKEYNKCPLCNMVYKNLGMCRVSDLCTFCEYNIKCDACNNVQRAGLLLCPLHMPKNNNQVYPYPPKEYMEEFCIWCTKFPPFQYNWIKYNNKSSRGELK